MSLISVSNLTFCYEGSYDNIFEDVSFQIDTDWKLGFIGRNGRGKTTFLNLLLGKFEYRGNISANVNFEYFPYAIDDKSQLTIDVIDGIGGGFQLWEIQRELSRLEVSDDVLYRPFETLSNGEQTKVLLAAMFLKENSFLLIDEPTNHLDVEARDLVARYLNSKKGFILVSHDRAFLDSCIDHVLSINKTNIEVQSGNFSTWYYNKQLQDSFELKKNEKLKKEIKRLEVSARQKADWSNKVEASKIGEHVFDRGHVGHLAAKMMKRAKIIEKRQKQAIEEKSKLLKNIETAEPLKIKTIQHHAKRLVELADVSLFYGPKKVAENVSFVIEQGDRIALWGRNGSGKSSIIKLICGENMEYTGEVYKASNLTISYVPQDTSFLKGSLNDYAEENKLDKSLFLTILRKLDFERVQFEKDMSDFSAGQKKKVLIARSLCENANLFVWDEPMNYIDIMSRMQIEELIMEYRPTMLFVEHDIAFCENIATKIIQL
ncbi:MAG TPA: Lsa family ABC-F type ribosomal protection protein [Thermoclostridium sp.]